MENANLEFAKKKLIDNNTLVCQKDEICYTSTLSGISPMLKFIAEGIDLSGFSVADVIVGKAAAMLFVKAGITQVYTKVISNAGLQYLKSHKVIVYYDEVVKMINNRTKTGMCPMEETVLKIDDYNEGFEALKVKIKSLRS